MDTHEREDWVIQVHPGREPEIGRWLGALQDTRVRTMRHLSGLSQAVIDWLPENKMSSIGTILYHIAGIEADYLYTEVLEQPVPPEISELFPYDIRDGQGHLTQVLGCGLEEHLQRLETVRGLLLGVYQSMALSEFRRIRSLPDYEITPEYVLHHLMQHEAEHRSQISELRARAEQTLAPG